MDLKSLVFLGYDRQIQPLSCVSRDGSKVKTNIYKGTQVGKPAFPDKQTFFVEIQPTQFGLFLNQA